MSCLDKEILVPPIKRLSHRIVDFFEEPAITYEKIYGALPKTFLYESGTPGGMNGNLSIMGSFNSLIIRFFEKFVEIERNGEVERSEESPRNTLKSLLKNLLLPNVNEPFCGGVVGYLGYESLVFFEDLSLDVKKKGDIPLVYLGLTDEVVVIDHRKKEANLFVSIFSENELYEKSLRMEALKRAIASPRINFVDKNFMAGTPSSRTGPGDFFRMVKRAKEYIREGDIFQTNLSQRFSARFNGSSWGFYSRLKKINPSPFQGYMNFGDIELISGSPERLIKVDSGRIETRPIAGTRRRGRKPAEDKRLSEELVLNEKERAEHLMLVDLERNDMGRVCKYGSVRVGEFMGLESYSHVWHIVSSVTGLLKESVTLMDILGACFPGGTITGCPKVRCMEIIDELEPVNRGVYTGSMGYFGWGGKVDLNILIRSAIVTKGEVRFSVGAGIVADSDPQCEYRETLIKAEAIMEALGCS